MERLDPDPTRIVGYPTVPCDFATVERELTMMAGAEVNVVLRREFNSIEVTRSNGTMTLPRKVNWPEGRLRYLLDDEGSTSFEISEEELTRAEYSPGCVWLEVGPFVLMVERRHGVGMPDPFADQREEPA